MFEQILQNPNDPELNFRYARLAEEKELLRKALGAYERILLNDPDNEEAKAGLRRIKRALEPPFTEVAAILGVRYESNPRHLEGGGSGNDDVVLRGKVVVTDERRLGSRRWRTNGELFANLHAEFGEIDFGYIGARTGPVFELSGDWRLRPALGVAFAWLDSEPFLIEGSLYLNFEADHSGAFRRVDIRVSYDRIGTEFSDRDGVVIEASPRFVFPEVLTARDAVVVRPLYRYNGATGDAPEGLFDDGDIFPERYHQLGGRADYFFPLADGVYGGVNFATSYRFFADSVAGGPDDRRDFFIAPGAEVIVPDVFHRNHDVIVGYRYERNFSNDGDEKFENHIVGIRSAWRF